jgi:hypothetical protein
MSADEEEAVMKELAVLQAELVSSGIRWFPVFLTGYSFRLLRVPSSCQRPRFLILSPDQRVS